MALNVVTTDAAGRVIRPPFSWSYSRIKNYDTCPRRYHQVDVLKKFKEEDSTELREGFVVHDAMARRINQSVPLPPVAPYEHWISYISYGLNPDSILSAERKLAITDRFEPCDYFDKIKPVWLRTVADVLKIQGDYAHIVDWKTGKVKPDPEQLMLIATCVMAHYPQVMRVKAELVWLAFNTKTTIDCTANDVAEFWPTMLDKVNNLRQAHETENFPPIRSGLCRKHCVVTTCDHCGQ